MKKRNPAQWEQWTLAVITVLQAWSRIGAIDSWRLARSAGVPQRYISPIVQDIRLAIPDVPLSSSRRGYWMTFDPDAGERFRRWRHNTALTVLRVWWHGEGLPRNRELAKTDPVRAANQVRRVEYVLAELAAAFNNTP